ncbi:MAG: DUF2281 domain-containing protein [Anaerolineales bacterium]|nr:DUF2281 domain-containing protein [Anaerolineales bacterium]
MTIIEKIKNNVEQLPPEKQIEVLDFIAFLLEKKKSLSKNKLENERKEGLKESFQRLAQMKTFADIEDPVLWQKRLRQDRVLPGRES